MSTPCQFQCPLTPDMVVKIAELVENGDPPRLISAKEVGQRLGISVQAVYKFAKGRILPTVRIGRYVRFEQASIEAWIKTRKKARNPVREARLMKRPMRTEPVTVEDVSKTLNMPKGWIAAEQTRGGRR